MNGEVGVSYKSVDSCSFRIFVKYLYNVAFLFAKGGEESLLYGLRSIFLCGIPHHSLHKVLCRGDEGCLIVANEAMATCRGRGIDAPRESKTVAPIAVGNACSDK